MEAARQLLQRQGLPRRGRQGHPRQGLRAPRDPRRQRRRRQARLHGRQREPAAAGPHGLHGGLRPDRQRRPDHLGLPAAQRLQPHHRPDLLHGLRQRQAHRPGHARRPHDAHPLLRGHSRRLALPGRVLVLGSHQQEPRQVRRERRSHRHAARHRRLQGQRERRRLQHQRPGHAGHHRDRRPRRGHPVRLAVLHVEGHRGLRRRAHHLVDVHRRLEGPDLRRDLRRRRRHGHHHQPHLPRLAEHVAFHHFYRHRGGRQRDARPASVLHARPARDRLRSPGRRVEQRHRQLQLVHVAQVHDRPGHRRSRLDPGQERHLPHRLQAAGLDHRQGRPGHLGGHRRRPQPRDLRRPDRRALHHHLRGGRSAAPDAVRRVGARRGHLQRGALPRRGHPQRRRHHLAGAARRGRPHLHHHPDRLQGRAAHRRGRRQGDHRLRRLPVAQGLRVLRGLLAAAERHAVRGVRHDHLRPGSGRRRHHDLQAVLRVRPRGLRGAVLEGVRRRRGNPRARRSRQRRERLAPGLCGCLRQGGCPGKRSGHLDVVQLRGRRRQHHHPDAPDRRRVPARPVHHRLQLPGRHLHDQRRVVHLRPVRHDQGRRQRGHPPVLHAGYLQAHAQAQRRRHLHRRQLDQELQRRGQRLRAHRLDRRHERLAALPAGRGCREASGLQARGLVHHQRRHGHGRCRLRAALQQPHEQPQLLRQRHLLPGGHQLHRARFRCGHRGVHVRRVGRRGVQLPDRLLQGRRRPGHARVHQHQRLAQVRHRRHRRPARHRPLRPAGPLQARHQLDVQRQRPRLRLPRLHAGPHRRAQRPQRGDQRRSHQSHGLPRVLQGQRRHAVQGPPRLRRRRRQHLRGAHRDPPVHHRQGVAAGVDRPRYRHGAVPDRLRGQRQPHLRHPRQREPDDHHAELPAGRDDRQRVHLRLHRLQVPSQLRRLRAGHHPADEPRGPHLRRRQVRVHAVLRGRGPAAHLRAG